MAQPFQVGHLMTLLKRLAFYFVLGFLHGKLTLRQTLKWVSIARKANSTDAQPDFGYPLRMREWISDYIAAEKEALDSIPVDEVAKAIDTVKGALKEDRQIFVFGNGGSAANCSHFATDLGKGSSDAVGKRFKVLSLNDNVSWMTAIGNDYAYEDIYRRQLENYGQAGDVVLTMSVSGSSPNLVEAVNWANTNGLHTIALVGGKRGKLAELATQCIVIDDTHYGRAEDCQMGIAHMICYAFMENPQWAK
jgi:D-sedoheptulose 7-phosphate isomerase